jgi:hypothetical protein
VDNISLGGLVDKVWGIDNITSQRTFIWPGSIIRRAVAKSSVKSICEVKRNKTHIPGQ